MTDEDRDALDDDDLDDEYQRDAYALVTATLGARAAQQRAAYGVVSEDEADTEEEFADDVLSEIFRRHGMRGRAMLIVVLNEVVADLVEQAAIPFVLDEDDLTKTALRLWQRYTANGPEAPLWNEDDL